MKNLKFRNFIWEVEGTIFNTTPAFTYAFSKALGELGVPLSMDRVDRLVRLSTGDCVQTLANEAHVDYLFLDRQFSRIYAGISPLNQPVNPGAVPFLDSVRAAGGVNVIASQRNFVSVMRLLFSHQITNYFKDIVTFDHSSPRKPKVDLFSTLLDRNDFDPQETLVISRQVDDVEAAKALDMQVCLFRPARECPEADFVIREYKELARQIEFVRMLEV